MASWADLKDKFLLEIFTAFHGTLMQGRAEIDISLHQGTTESRQWTFFFDLSSTLSKKHDLALPQGTHTNCATVGHFEFS